MWPMPLEFQQCKKTILGSGGSMWLSETRLSGRKMYENLCGKKFMGHLLT